MERILLVEDDAAIIRTLSAFLRGEGFSVNAVTGQQAAEAEITKGYDLALVDIGLAEGNGFAVCAAAKRAALPVIFLTAAGDEYSAVSGLDMGADDYIVKPFRPRELVSRIRSVLRRCSKRPCVIMLGDVTVDPERGMVTRGGVDLNLSALEYRLLMTFVNYRGQTLTRDRLLGEIWDSAGDFVSDNTLTVYIKRLREKIEKDPAAPEHIRTVRGIGYRLEG